ncbi:MAG: 3-deoxy-manno-octulosonate cytidylyltransferase [Bacteroidales bacterium]|nr:3-deoxy-manno-octulosonate cytidylyltransferase [Bacteroidales bacterium]
MNILGIIPARYASTRFPGKPLAMIGKRSMIQRVYEQVKKADVLLDVIVATDDKRIENHVKDFGGKVMMTSADHENGTDRCNEVVKNIQEKNPEKKWDVVVNIQGDEPFIDPSQIKIVTSCFSNKNAQIATLAKIISTKEELFNTNIVKIIIGKNNKAIFFSRQAIPFIRNSGKDNWLIKHEFYKHIGIYAYRTDVLSKITQLKKSSLEIAESLEQLRWLDNAYEIDVRLTNIESVGVDSPDDLKNIINNF